MRVRAVYEWEIDPAKWVTAGIEAEWYAEGDTDLTNLESVAYAATGYTDPDDNMPCWARDSMRVVSQIIEVVQ